MTSVATAPPEHEERLPFADVLGVRVCTLSLEQSANLIVEWGSDASLPNGPRYVCATSVHGIIEAHYQPDFKAILNSASMVAPDGMPLVWVGRLSGHRGIERVYGPSLTRRVCDLSVQHGLTHYFYGGLPGVARRLAESLPAEFPGFRVAGWYSPPFRPLTADEVTEVAETINRSGADLVWVGLSTPKQERWIASMRPKLSAKVLLSVGAAFDFNTGRIQQAPIWIRRSGLEWLFRISREPRRLWRRYASIVPRFLLLAALQLWGLKRFSRS